MKACIFDLDGTLTNTLESMTYSVNLTLKEMGLSQITKDQCRMFVGNGARVLIEESLKVSGDPKASRIEEGMNILGAHIESPRLDLKQKPLYEDGEIAYLDTHYYGGVKKYQWVSLPLSIFGVVCLKDGTVIDV